MIFLISLCIALIFSLLCSEVLRKKPLPFYVGAALISLFCAVSVWKGFVYPDWFNSFVFPIFARGALAGALFVIVMYAGVFAPGSFGAKAFMPIRAQLSIIACILTFGHNIAYGKTYFKMLFTSSGEMQTGTLIAAVCSLVMIAVMLPLFVTSFKSVRRKMSGKAWKKLQRLAYVFYFLLFVHVMLLTVPRLLMGAEGYDLTVFVYGFVFISYFLCRIIKAVYKNDKEKTVHRQMIAVSAALFAATLFVGTISTSSSSSSVASEGYSSYSYKDGTYSGEGMGNNGKINVDVTIVDGNIDSIEITKFPDDEEYFDVSVDGEMMIGRVIDAQGTDVDGISGATYSSEGFISAVESALEQARQ